MPPYFPQQQNYELQQQYGYPQQPAQPPVNPYAQMAGTLAGAQGGKYLGGQLLGGGDIAASGATELPSADILANTAAEFGATGGETATPFLGETATSAMPWLAPLAVAGIGAYTASKGYDALKNSEYSAKNPMTGLKQGIKSAGILNAVPVLGQLPWIAGVAGAMFGSGKDKDQHMRDMVRKDLQEKGFIDKNYNVSLADGNKFDIGKDGSYKNYNVDFTRSGIGDQVAALNPLAALMGGGNKKLTSDFVGYLSNAANSSGNSTKNLMKFYDDAGLSHDAAYGLIHQQYEKGQLDKATADAYKNGLDQLFGVGAYKGKGQQKFNIGAAGSAPVETKQAQSQPAIKPKDELVSPNKVESKPKAATKWRRNE